MRFGASVVAVALLMSALAIAPQVTADCPNPPRDCGSYIDGINVPMDDSLLSLGAYKDEVKETGEELEETTEASTDAWFILQDDGSFRPMAHDNGTSGEALQTGDHGGILVVVEEVGGASSFALTFTETTGGIVWDSDGSITISSPENDGHYLIPFTVTSTGKDLEFDYEIEDDRGNEEGGTMTVPIDGDGTTWLLYAALAVILVVLVVFMVRRRPPSSTTTSEDPGLADTSTPNADAGDDGGDDSPTDPLNR